MRALRAGIAAAALLASIATAQAEIRIAVAGPMSGSLALLGNQMRNGAEAAVAAINASGGLLGEEVVLEIGDDGCSADRAEATANQLAGAGVVFVIGHLCSAAAIAASSVYATEAIIQIAPGAPDPRFTEERPGPGIFRLFGREDDQGRAIAELLLTQPDEAFIAVIDDRSPYGGRLADWVADAMRELDRPPDLVDSYSVADPDFPGLVNRLQGAGIDALFIGGSTEDVAALKIAMTAAAYEPLLIGGDVLADPAFPELAGEAATGVVFTFQPDVAADPAAAEAVAAITAAGGSPRGFALYAYAAVEVWAAAVRQNGAVTGDTLSEVIADSEVDTAIGPVGFNEIGDYTGDGWVWYRWGAVTFERLSP